MGKFDNSKKHVTKQKKHPKLVRLWVRAKFLSFRRYSPQHPGRTSPSTPTKPSSDSKASTTTSLLSTTSESELRLCTRSTPARKTTSSG